MERATLTGAVILGGETQPGEGWPGKEPGNETPLSSLSSQDLPVARGKAAWGEAWPSRQEQGGAQNMLCPLQLLASQLLARTYLICHLIPGNCFPRPRAGAWRLPSCGACASPALPVERAAWHCELSEGHLPCESDGP